MPEDKTTVPEKIKKESRKHPRIAVYLKVAGTPKLNEHTLCTYNLTPSGAMLVATPPFKDLSNIEIGENLTLSFAINLTTGYVNIPSQVLWVKHKVLTPEDEQASCIGLKFKELHPTVSKQISTFLSAHTALANASTSKETKKTCRDCIHFQDNPGSKYAFCKLHKITVLNSEADLSMSFNQIYSHPCKDLTSK